MKNVKFYHIKDYISGAYKAANNLCRNVEKVIKA